MKRFASFTFLLCLLVLIGTVSSAPACGCGVIISDTEGSSISPRVSEERALVRFADGKQTIIFHFGLTGLASSTAFLMPVPSNAQMELAEESVFTDIDRQITPRQETRTRYVFANKVSGPERNDSSSGGVGLTSAPPGMDSFSSAAPPPDPVEVLQSKTLGNLDVVVLQAQDAKELEKWLEENGFQAPEGFAKEARYYVEKDWPFIAAKLSVKSANLAERGALQPLEITFDTKEMIYPLRLSRLAKQDYSLRLDIVAPEKVKLEGLGDSCEEPEQQVGGPALMISLYSGSLGAGGGRYETPKRCQTTLMYAGKAPSSFDGLLTSYEVNVDPDELDKDPTLKADPGQNDFQAVHYTIERKVLVEQLPRAVGGFLHLLLGAVLPLAAILYMVLSSKKHEDNLSTKIAMIVAGAGIVVLLIDRIFLETIPVLSFAFLAIGATLSFWHKSIVYLACFAILAVISILIPGTSIYYIILLILSLIAYGIRYVIRTVRSRARAT